jgi:hypothetical protein
MFKLILILLTIQLYNSQNNTNPCKNNDDCAILGNYYTCISVQADNSNLLYISQCVKEPTCSGNTFGSCPDFANWSNKYQSIKPECSFSVIENCNTVDCYNSKLNSTLYGIYKCVDANTINVVYNTTNIPETQVPDTFIPETNKPNINNTSSATNLMINILCIIINFIIIISLF